MREFFEHKPLLVERVPAGYAIRFNLEKIEEGWEATQVIAKELSYSKVVAAIVEYKFDTEEQLSLLSAKIEGKGFDENEWAEYQIWRAFASNYTAETLNMKRKKIYGKDVR